MRKSLALFVLVPFFLLLVVYSGVRAQEQVSQDRLKEEFFKSLKRPQIVSLLETLDRTRQLTDFELGAKYRWGYIPPDRRPPVSLTRWWQSKSQRQRSNLRVEWFRNHYDQLNLDRYARQLALIDRLNRLHRELQSQLGNGPGELERVHFPGDTPDPSMSVSGETQYPSVYRQEAGAESTPSATDPVSPQGTSDFPPGQWGGASESSDTRDRDREVPPDSSEPLEADTASADERREQNRNVRYRGVGDRIEVIESAADETTQPDTVSASSEEETQPDADRSAVDTGPSSPNFELNNTRKSSSSMRLPEPSLRSRSNRIPELRRSEPEKR